MFFLNKQRYELQILFRMEILQSEVGGGIEESSKQKFVKQICQLLENIQCHMEGGFFGDWNLESYVAKVIKSRYTMYNKTGRCLLCVFPEIINFLNYKLQRFVEFIACVFTSMS